MPLTQLFTLIESICWMTVSVGLALCIALSQGLAMQGLGLCMVLSRGLAMQGRNRQCMTLDLRKPEGRAVAKRLARRCDVLVENFRPGVLEDWGLGPRVRLSGSRVQGAGYVCDGPGQPEPADVGSGSLLS